ncbi:MAG: hypothetical protein ACLTEE_06205 [Anaerobutyricum hallii]
MDLIWDTFTIGKVTDRDGKKQVCPITLQQMRMQKIFKQLLIKTYSSKENITYNMTWTGTEWKARQSSEMTQLPEIEVKGEKEV